MFSNVSSNFPRGAFIDLGQEQRFGGRRRARRRYRRSSRSWRNRIPVTLGRGDPNLERRRRMLTLIRRRADQRAARAAPRPRRPLFVSPLDQYDVVHDRGVSIGLNNQRRGHRAYMNLNAYSAAARSAANIGAARALRAEAAAREAAALDPASRISVDVPSVPVQPISPVTQEMFNQTARVEAESAARLAEAAELGRLAAQLRTPWHSSTGNARTVREQLMAERRAQYRPIHIGWQELERRRNLLDSRVQGRYAQQQDRRRVEQLMELATRHAEYPLIPGQIPDADGFVWHGNDAVDLFNTTVPRETLLHMDNIHGRNFAEMRRADRAYMMYRDRDQYKRWRSMQHRMERNAATKIQKAWRAYQERKNPVIEVDRNMGSTNI